MKTRTQAWKDTAEKALAASLKDLYDAAEALINQRVYPYVPIQLQDVPTIEIGPAVTWPYRNGEPELGDLKRIIVDAPGGVASWYWVSEGVTAQALLRVFDGMPDRVATAIRKLEEAAKWCRDTMWRREREAERILEQKKSDVEFVEARALMAALS